MKKNKLKGIQYRRQKKRMRQLSRRKKHHYSLPKEKQNTVRKNMSKRLLVPCNFSISQHTDDTVLFFVSTFDAIKGCKKGDDLFFDMKEVEFIDPGAIMYLIAVINNAKHVRLLRLKCSGNFPNNVIAQNVIEKVGFYDYVKVPGRKIVSKDPNRIRILHGREPNVEITSSICDFVNEKMNSETKLLTKRLYPILIELMTNVRQHAYRYGSSTMNPEWYVYVENLESEIRFVFLDSGMGIPNTVRKNWVEILKDSFGMLLGDRGDPDYIEAALQGKFRTETRQENRGKGLPEIYNAVVSRNSRFKEMLVISGRGKCRVGIDGRIEKTYIEGTFEGTMFMWNFIKGDYSYGSD